MKSHLKNKVQNKFTYNRSFLDQANDTADKFENH